ncbi:MAG: NAD(P)H-dependent glycerol-3-phosphate dehydrogenase [Planctomycetota bacterium]|nr:NAD(P)H-dependent glycerol-3-phosphate dehydrogenase [Planctomycetota bacterium]
MPKGTRGKRTKVDRPMVGVVGMGQMGLVCAAILADRSADEPETSAPHANMHRPVRVTLWSHDASEGDQVARSRQSPRLPGFRLPAEVGVVAGDDGLEALRECSVLVSAVPVQFTREVWSRAAAHVKPGAAIVSVAKGIEVKTLRRPTQILAEALGDDPDKPARPLGVLSGPTIAGELARCLPATMVAASDDADLALTIQRLFGTRWLRVYTNQDVLGVELAGAAKNVIAIAGGIIDGLQAGYNAKSALLSRGIAEIARLGVAMGASSATFFGIAGVGDLATSCFSPEGRNRSCGEALGKGVKLKDYLKGTRGVVEGVWTAKALVRLAKKYRVDMPIAGAVHSVLFKGMDPIEAISGLMSRQQKAERVG